MARDPIRTRGDRRGSRGDRAQDGRPRHRQAGRPVLLGRLPRPLVRGAGGDRSGVLPGAIRGAAQPARRAGRLPSPVSALGGASEPGGMAFARRAFPSRTRAGRGGRRDGGGPSGGRGPDRAHPGKGRRRRPPERLPGTARRAVSSP